MKPEAGIRKERELALSAMRELFAGFEARIVRQRTLPHPTDGSLYDVDANRLSRRSFVDGDLSASGQGGFCRREAVGAIHKPMLGAATVRVFVALDFSWGPKPWRLHADQVRRAAEWALASQRPDVYFILGLATVGEADGPGPGGEVVRALASGPNWRAALLEWLNPGWRITAPKDGVILPTLFENLFDPEPLAQKIARVDQALKTAQELQEPGGFLMLEEIARRAAVREEIVTERAVAFAGGTPGLDVKDVGGSLIIQRDRFSSMSA